MSKDLPIDPYEAVVADLKAKRSEIDAALAAIERFRSVGANPARLAETVSTAPPSPPSPPQPALPETSPFYGLGLREAGPKHLMLVGVPQTAREIWNALDAAGYQTAHGDPVHAVNDAMRRRAKTHSDILLVGEGKWGLKGWYTEAELEDIRKKVGGMGGRDRAAHAESTKLGMIVARRRGAKPGQPTKLPPEAEAEVERMLREGMSVRDVATKVGVTPTTIYNRLGKERIQELRAASKALPHEASGTPRVVN